MLIPVKSQTDKSVSNETLVDTKSTIKNKTTALLHETLVDYKSTHQTLYTPLMSSIYGQSSTAYTKKNNIYPCQDEKKKEENNKHVIYTNMKQIFCKTNIYETSLYMSN